MENTIKDSWSIQGESKNCGGQGETKMKQLCVMLLG